MKLDNKRIVITGGTGSFGNKVASFLAKQSPSEIIIYSRDEKKQYEMKALYPEYSYWIGDVRDKDRLREVMTGVDCIFHAAALKQVPSCESYPFEAVKTNVLGSQNLSEVAIEKGVSTVVALSTDKAVKPINAMGISKAMMEKIICSQNQFPISTKFCCVRYGNVMGSRGSVIPLFKSLIEKKEKLTITNPNMTRFMMTLDESVELVLHALVNLEGGEVFVKKAPATTVKHLAECMLKKYGDGDIERIEEIGMRPGEKLDEVLLNEYEIRRSKESDQFFEISPEYKKGHQNNDFPIGYEYSSSNTHQLISYNEISALLDKAGDNELYT